MPKQEKKKKKSGRFHPDGVDEIGVDACDMNFSNSEFAGTDAFPKILLDSIRAIITSLDERDPYTHGHSLRVAEYSVLLGKEIQLPQEKINELELTALLHDIGKIGIPDQVLFKPNRLSKSEFEIMKSHPVRSARIIERIPSLKHLLPGIRGHHERYDGLGYPNGTSGENIPLNARIVLIADTFDAMTSTRPYRLALTREAAIEELRRCAGVQFDPNLVEIFVTAVEKKSTGISQKKKTIHKKVA